MQTPIRVGLCLCILATAPASIHADQTIRFPERAVGKLSIRPASPREFRHAPSDKGIFDGWLPFVPASGEVVLPDDHDVRLELNYDGAVDLRWVDQLPPDAIDALSAYGLPIDDAGVLKLSSRLTGLRSLSLDATTITSGAARSLSALVKLQHLTVHSTSVGDDAMAVIAALPDLETVGLYRTGITDAGLKKLAKSRSLKAVYVGRTRITDAGVAELCKLNDLRALNLLAGDPEFRGDEPAPVITDRVVESLCTCPGLEYLDLSGAELTDDGLEKLASKLVNVKGLVLDFTKVTPQGIRHLAGFPNLEKLRFQGLTLGDEAASYLASLSNLRQITGDTEFSDAGVHKLGALRRLESLHLDGHRITDASMPILRSMGALKELRLQHTQITDDGFALLAGSESIEHIQLTRNRMTTRCIETLARMPRLTHVGLMDIPPRADGKSAWKGLEALSRLEEELWLCLCPPLSHEDFEKLSTFSALQQLRIEGGFQGGAGRPVTDADLLAIAGLEQLEYLQLTSTVVTDESLASLAKRPALRRLTISCLATDAGLTAIAQSPVLEHLAIGSPNLTDVVLKRVSAENPRLTIRRQPFELEGTPVSSSPSDRFWRSRPIEEREELNALEGKDSPNLAVSGWLNAAEDLTLQDLHGKVVLIEFWGTWCGPCLAQLPEIRRLRDEYAEQGLVVVGIHSTKSAEGAAEFVKANNIDWPIAVDHEDQSRVAYCLQGWPTCYIIDRRGVLRMADVFSGDREAAIKALLAEE